MIKTILLGLGAAATLSAAPFNYFDGTFNDADWSAQIVFQNGAPPSFTASQSNAGGNPGDYRFGTHFYGGPQGGGISVGHLNLNATWDPSTDGAIDSLSLQFDAAAFNTGLSGAIAFLPYLEQNGLSYYGSPGMISVLPSWTTYTYATLGEANFWDYNGSGNPDFSEDGSEITFGYITSNGTGFGFSETSFGLDNWNLTIHSDGPTEQPVPEPATILGAAALAALIARRARKRC